MQGKEKHLFEKTFIDASWDDLRSQLDAQLPVEKKPQQNKAAILILLSLLTIAIGFASFFAYKYKSIIPQAALTKEKTLTKTIYQVIERTVQSETSEVGIDKSKSTEIKKARKSTSSESPTIEQQDEQASTSEEPILSQLITKLQAIPAKQQLLISETTKNIKEGNSLNAEKPKRKRSINFNIGLQTSASTDLDYTGYGVASSFVFPIGNRFGINAGLGFNILSKDHYFISQIPRDNKTDIKTNTNGPIDLRSLKQIYLPVSLNYELLPGLAVNSGVRIRYTYEEDVENLIPVPTRAVGGTANDASFIDRTNLGLSAGVSYDFSKNMSLLLDSEWGFNSLMNQSIFSDPSRLNYDLNLINLTTNIRF